MEKQKIRNTYDMVYEMLTLHPETRGSDRLLIRRVYEDCCKVNPWMPFCEVIMNKDLPSTETIRRTRQKIQQEFEDLRATKEVEKERMALQETWLDFVKGEA